eukprot:2007612-Amphidinium_carterae.1
MGPGRSALAFARKLILTTRSVTFLSSSQTTGRQRPPQQEPHKYSPNIAKPPTPQKPPNPPTNERGF